MGTGAGPASPRSFRAERRRSRIRRPFTNGVRLQLCAGLYHRSARASRIASWGAPSSAPPAPNVGGLDRARDEPAIGGERRPNRPRSRRSLHVAGEPRRAAGGHQCVGATLISHATRDRDSSTQAASQNATLAWSGVWNRIVTAIRTRAAGHFSRAGGSLLTSAAGTGRAASKASLDRITTMSTASISRCWVGRGATWCAPVG